ncbi:MAG: hypothetical protein RLZZ46_313, partial [Bacteroidota bacterium]
YWMDKGYFKSVPDQRESYTIVIPPPNVTGVLHMGHMLNNTIQDVLIRRARMQGKNACWVPGTDHASIATEAKVVAMLKERGISKTDLSREQFLEYAWEWKEKYGGIILEQLKKLGASCDWDRTRFTMEEDLSDAVIGVFIDLYKKGHIYRGVRMVNWDPAGMTAVSDEEVIHKEVDSRLFYVRYRLVPKNPSDEAEYITIATTRPETIPGDTAVCVHPEDIRYSGLKGRKVMIPLVDREVPVIFDEYITMEFGTGALKVTPAHDENDYKLGQKHGLESIDTLNPDGTLSQAAQVFVGMDRFEARKQIARKLEEEGMIVKIENIRNKVGYSERTNAVIEPRLSMQWFLRMKELSEPALEHVINGDIRLIPDKFINTYRHWMENVHDWCISRQLWWGQRIPAWYNREGHFVVARTEEEALSEFKLLNEKRRIDGKPDLSIEGIRQDEDVLDTWFSSWLWPISVFDGFKNPGNKDIRYYYPTQDLVTAPEILFFWVARMIIAGYEYMGDKPFSNVYLTGIVRDKLGRKMSKSLGNSPDPLELIERFGADGVRMGMLVCSPSGNDLLFDESLCEQGRNFSNKLWNAFRLISSWKTDRSLAAGETSVMAAEWFAARLKQQFVLIDDHYEKRRISDALMLTYKLIWDDFCSIYLELVKPEYREGEPVFIDETTLKLTLDYFERLLGLLHPFMPFITEELWHLVRERAEGEDLIISAWPVREEADSSVITLMDQALNCVQEIRNIRNQKNIALREKLHVFVQYHADDRDLKRAESVMQKLAGLGGIEEGVKEGAGFAAVLISKSSFRIDLGAYLNPDEEKARIISEMDYLKGFLESVNKKLGNERFVQNAKPEVVEMEKRKRIDAESKLESLHQQLELLK